MRRPTSNNNLSSSMEAATLSNGGEGASDRSYMNAHRYLRTLQSRIRELTENDTKNPEQVTRLQQKVLDVKDVFALIERELEHVEDDDWKPRLKLPPRLIEPDAPVRTASAPPEDVRPRDVRRSPANDRSEPTSDTASRYRPSEDYRPSPPPSLPKAPSPPPAVAFAALPDLQSSVRSAHSTQVPTPNRRSKDARGTEASAPLSPLPPNMEFNHGPLFSDCVASLKLSEYVYDLVDAKTDLKDARDKLRKAEEADDNANVQKYKKKAAKYDVEIKELEQDHWKKEVNPLRQAYSIEIMRCLQQLNAGIKYTEDLPDNGKAEADALADMSLLKDWLNRCLNQPKTWRKDDKLLVGLTEGHPQRKLKDASYVKDLLEEASPTPTKKQDEGKAASSSRKRDDESDSDRRSKAAESGGATKPIAINADLLEGLLNGAVPKEVAANITQCQECEGTGGDLGHAKICSECGGEGKKNSKDIIELCPKCNGRGFQMSRKYRCPVCDAYKIVMNVPADTVDPRQSKDRARDTPTDSETDRDRKPSRSDSTRRKASFAPDAVPDAISQRSRSNKGRDRDFSPDPRDEPEEDPRKSKSRNQGRRDRYDDDMRDPSPDSRSASPDNKPSRSRSRRDKSQTRPKEEQPEAGAGLTGLIGAIAGAAQEPGSWTGKKGKKILEAALAAGAGGMLGGGGGGGGEQSDDGRSEDDNDNRNERKRSKRRGSRYER